MYGDIYELCRNVEKVMGMFSKELQKMDRNTVQYMIDEMQDQIDRQMDQIDRQMDQIGRQADQIALKDAEIEKLKKTGSGITE